MNVLYTNFWAALFRGEFGNMTSVTLKMALVGATYLGIAAETKRDTHQYFDDITDELSGSGYPAGGITLANVTFTIDNTANTVKIDCDDVVTPTMTGSAYGAIIYRDTGTPATSPLLGFFDLPLGNSGAPLIASNEQITIPIPTGGFATLSAAVGS